MYDLQNTDLNAIYDISDINAKIDYLNSKVLETFDVHVPIIARKFCRPKAPWLQKILNL